MTSFTTTPPTIEAHLRSAIKEGIRLYNHGNLVGALRTYTRAAESFSHADDRLQQALAALPHCEDATDAWACILRGMLADLLTMNNANANPVAIERVIAEGEQNWLSNRHGIALVKYQSYFQNRNRFRTSTKLEDEVLSSIKRHHVLQRTAAHAFVLLYAMKRILQAPASPPPHPDRFAFFLRPILTTSDSEVAKANSINAKWGGIHVCLSNFAPAKGQRTYDWPEHGVCSFRHALIAMCDAARRVARVGKHRWTLSDDVTRLDTVESVLPLIKSERTGSGMLLLCGNPSKKYQKSKTLSAICQAANTCNLYRARKPEQLHVNLGKSWNTDGHTAIIRAVLLKCSRWEIVVVKCGAKSCPRTQLRVTEIVERRELAW
jgi:hypothetical protein